MMDWNGHMTAGGWIASVLAIVIIVVLVVAAVAWIARERSDRRNRGAATAISAREILDRRLASGEIKAEHYEQLRQTLASQPNPASGSPPVGPADIHA